MNEEFNYYPVVPDNTSSPGALDPEKLDKIKPNTEDVKPSDTNLVPSGNGTVMNTGDLKSPNFVIGSSGWIIRSDGTAEFGYLVIRNGSRIANWYVNTNTISSGSVEATSGILLDSANSLIRVGSTAGNYITIDGPNFRFRSSNYVAGVSGFTIEPTLIEAENIVARGTLRGVTFKYDVISAVGGQLMVANSDSLASDMTAADNSTLTIKGDTTFAVNDILVIRGVTGSGIQEEWLRVTNIGSAPTYTVTRDLASAYAANSNPAWQTGTAVVKQGKSDGAATYSGGWLRLLGEGTNSPYYSVFSRTGIAYNSYSERVRLGNLNGIGAFVSDTYGIFIGDYSSGKYMTYDDVSGNLNVNGYVAYNKGAFGGDGSDGALSISSGTTTVSASSADVLIKYYSSISITGTGKLAFSNPGTTGTYIILKCLNNCTLTSSTAPMIDCSGMGAAGGTGSGANGAAGTTAVYILDTSNHHGTGAIQGGAVGAAGAIYSNTFLYTKNNRDSVRGYVTIAPGSGGGQGAGGSGQPGGAGGNGGGALNMEIGGAINFTTALGISVAGVNGTAGANEGAGSGSGGGGGGAAGMAVIFYRTLTAASGTINSAGGAGGAGGTGTGAGTAAPGGGGAGAYGGAGGAGGTATGGNGGNAGGTGAGGGGGGNQNGGAGAGTGGTAGTSDAGIISQSYLR